MTFSAAIPDSQLAREITELVRDKIGRAHV